MNRDAPDAAVIELLRRLCPEWRGRKPAPRYRTRGYLPRGEKS